MVLRYPEPNLLRLFERSEIPVVRQELLRFQTKNRNVSRFRLQYMQVKKDRNITCHDAAILNEQAQSRFCNNFAVCTCCQSFCTAFPGLFCSEQRLFCPTCAYEEVFCYLYPTASLVPLALIGHGFHVGPHLRPWLRVKGACP